MTDKYKMAFWRHSRKSAASIATSGVESNSTPRVWLLDFDDTLVRTTPEQGIKLLKEVFDHPELRQACTSLDLSPGILTQAKHLLTPEKFRDLETKRGETLSIIRFGEAILQEAGIYEDEVLDEARRIFYEVEKQQGSYQEVPGALDFLKTRKRNNESIAIVSQGPLSVIEAKLEGLGMQELIDVVVAVVDDKTGEKLRKKPHEEIYLKALRRLKENGKITDEQLHNPDSRIVVMGDHPVRDIQGGKNLEAALDNPHARVVTVLLNSQKTSLSPEKVIPEPDITVNSWSELENKLRYNKLSALNVGNYMDRS